MLVLGAAAGGGAACGEGYGPGGGGGQPPVTVRSPSRSDGGGPSFPLPVDAGVSCDRPLEPTVSEGACAVDAGPRIRCNPLTNGNCVDGAVCDFSVSTGEFRCLSSGKAPLCGRCGEGAEGPICAAGTTCRGGAGVCARFCCTHADCGAGSCIPQPPSPVGICDAVGVDRLRTFGVGEHGGGPRPEARALCDLPAKGPFAGDCVRLGGEVLCHPVSNEGCEPGATCAVIPGGFRCLPDRAPPATTDPDAGAAAGAGRIPPGTLCGACDVADVGGPTCTAGLHCVNGSCARFCCWDDDCGGAPCDRTFFGALGVGVCISTAGAEGSAGAAP